MKDFLLVYILPLLTGAFVGYLGLRETTTIKQYLKLIVFLLIPVVNIVITVLIIYVASADYIQNNEKIQDFLNKKL